MDCSTTAAETHLRAADAAMKALTGDGFPALTQALRSAVVALTPPAEVTEQYVSARVGAWADRRSAVRWMKLFIWALVAAAIAIAWFNRERLLRLLPG